MKKNSSETNFIYLPGFEKPQDIHNDEKISELRKNKDSLVKDINLYQVLFEQVAVGIAIATLDGRWLQINKKLCDIFGCAEEELLGRSFLEIRHPEDNEKNMRIIKGFLEGNSDNIWLDMRYLVRHLIDGWINLNVTIIRNADGKSLYSLFIIDDITIRKEIEKNFKNVIMNLWNSTRNLNLPGRVWKKRLLNSKRPASINLIFLQTCRMN
jgi:PAS domain S-box-containing protein